MGFDGGGVRIEREAAPIEEDGEKLGCGLIGIGGGI